MELVCTSCAFVIIVLNVYEVVKLKNDYSFFSVSFFVLVVRKKRIFL